MIYIEKENSESDWLLSWQDAPVDLQISSTAEQLSRLLANRWLKTCIWTCTHSGRPLLLQWRLATGRRDRDQQWGCVSGQITRDKPLNVDRRWVWEPRTGIGRRCSIVCWNTKRWWQVFVQIQQERVWLLVLLQVQQRRLAVKIWVPLQESSVLQWEVHGIPWNASKPMHGGQEERLEPWSTQLWDCWRPH